MIIFFYISLIPATAVIFIALIVGIYRSIVKPPKVTSFDWSMITYEYKQKNGMLAVILTVIFGSFGIGFLNVKLAAFFAFFNMAVYVYVFGETFMVPSAPPYAFLIPIARAVNVVVAIIFHRFQLKVAKEQFARYVDEDLYRKQVKAYKEEDEALPEAERERVRKERYEKEKEELYTLWMGTAEA